MSRRVGAVVDVSRRESRLIKILSSSCVNTQQGPIFNPQQMPTTLDWRWAVDAETNRTVGGIVAAVLRTNPGDSALKVAVHGVALSKMLRQLKCSADNGRTWIFATAKTIIPESEVDPTSFAQRYRHKWPSNAGPVEGDNNLLGVRFTCAFPTDGATKLSAAKVGGNREKDEREGEGNSDEREGRKIKNRFKSYATSESDATTSLPMQLSFQSSLGSITLWQIDGVRLRCPGYPITDEALPCAKHLARRQQLPQPSRLVWQPFPSSAERAPAAGVDVTVCVQYVYGTGYSAQSILEFASWYLLLGARRLVIFDSMEPELEPGESKLIASERMSALNALAATLGHRLSLVRGLATWDMMRRTRTHMNGQSIAGNMCKSAAGALATPGRAAYALLPDLDEFLSPPSSDADISGRLGSQLAGSLERLARHVHGGEPATAHYLDDDTSVRSRVHRGVGSRRCLSFASIYYYPPTCESTLNAHGSGSRTNISHSGKTSTTVQVGGSSNDLPAVIRRSWRGQPDNFEFGPSHNWTAFPHWNFMVRSKFLVDAADDGVLTGNHECCCKQGLVVGRQCSTRSGLLGNHSCSTVEFMPLEFWHIRHLKGGGQASGPCRKSASISSVLAVNGKRQRIPTVPEEHVFPQSWRSEYLLMLSNLSWAFREAVNVG